MRDPFFVVTTGRSGSVSLALTLSMHPLVCALHEPWRWLIEGSWKKLTGREVGPIVEAFRGWVPVPAGVQLCGIVDQKLSAFIPELAEAFPGSKFIWLVRDGRSVVASGYERGWYQDGEENLDHAWARWRWRGPEIVSSSGDAMDPGRWAELGAFGRNCWYWDWVNRLIRRELAEIGDEKRVGAYRLEDLADEENGGRYLVDLQHWLGLAPVALEMADANKGPGRMRWETWSEAQRGQFEEMCGEMMAALGYGDEGAG